MRARGRVWGRVSDEWPEGRTKVDWLQKCQFEVCSRRSPKNQIVVFQRSKKVISRLRHDSKQRVICSHFSYSREHQPGLHSARVEGLLNSLCSRLSAFDLDRTNKRSNDRWNVCD